MAQLYILYFKNSNFTKIRTNKLKNNCIKPYRIKIVIYCSFLIIEWKINHAFTVAFVTLKVGFNSRLEGFLPDTVIG